MSRLLLSSSLRKACSISSLAPKCKKSSNDTMHKQRIISKLTTLNPTNICRMQKIIERYHAQAKYNKQTDNTESDQYLQQLKLETEKMAKKIELLEVSKRYSWPIR